MLLTDVDRSLLYRVVEDCAQTAYPVAETLLESFERHLGLRHMVVFAGRNPADALASEPLALTGRTCAMAGVYCDRFFRDDVFRTPTAGQRLSCNGTISLHDVEPGLLERHTEYVRDFHGSFGTRSMVISNIAVAPGQCAIVAALEFEGDVPRTTMRRLAAIRPLLGAYLRNLGNACPVVRPRLTPREEQIVALVRCGLSNDEIARTCAIKPDSVKRYLTGIFAAYGVHSRTQLAIAAGG